MFTRWLHFGLFFFSGVFRIFFLMCLSLADRCLAFWFFLELVGLSIIPAFFVFRQERLTRVYGGLILYVVVSAVSSVFIVTGVIVAGLHLLTLVGFILKMGLFPFSV